MDLALDAEKHPTRSLARVLAPLQEEYDYIFLDCPPSISLVSESVFEAADVLLVPLIPATLSSRTFGQLRKVVGEQAQVMAFFSMVDARKRLHREVMEALGGEHDAVLETAIPSASDVERMGRERTVVEAFSPRGRAAAACRALWDEVRGRLSVGAGGHP
jgi:cellulose biosynthesis protein BcsQ